MMKKYFHKNVATKLLATLIATSLSFVSQQARADVNNVGLNQSAFNAMNDSIRADENRLEATRESSYSKLLTNGVWAQAFGTRARQDNKRGFSGYNSISTGVAFGGDTKISKDTTVGVALSFANSDIKSTDKLKATDIDSYQANIYAGKVYGKYFLDGIAGVTLNRYESQRNIAAAGATASANYGGQTYAAKIKAGFVERFENNFELVPETSLIYARNHINSYGEDGAGAAGLQVTNRDANFLEGVVGVGLGYNALTYKTAKIYPKIKVSYGYDFMGNRQTATSNFTGQAVSFDTSSSRINRSSIKVNAGFNVCALNNVTITADYILEHKVTYQSHSGIVRAKYEF